MQNSEPASISVSATITTGTTTVPQCNKNTNERRPSWRLRIDNGCKVCVSAYFNVSNCSDVFNFFFSFCYPPPFCCTCCNQNNDNQNFITFVGVLELLDYANFLSLPFNVRKN